MSEMPDSSRSEIELQKLRLEVEKLKLDVAGSERFRTLDLLIKILPTVTVLLTVLGFMFTVWQYRSEQKEKRGAVQIQLAKDKSERDDRTRTEIESAQREFMKPLIEKQQALYFEAAGAAATIASSSDARERARATDTFWKLYWGQLVMVESTEVSGKMKAFGNCLSGLDQCSSVEVKNRSLALASVLEESLLKTWNAKPEEFTNSQFKYR